MAESSSPIENALSASLASEFIVGLKFGELPGTAVQMVKRCFLDFLGIALASDGLPAVESGMGLLDALGRSEDTTIIGHKTKASLIGAIWINSLLGSALDLEDGYYPSVGHPASVVFPVTLGLAERERASPEEFITASIIGYEVCARSGMLMTRSYRDKPRGSGGSSVYGAAAAATRLLRLDQKHVEIALGVAGSYMTSVPVIRSHRHEAMIKGGIPWGAVVGAVSAFLGQQGFTSPPATLQDPFFALDDESARVVLQTLGKTYEILNVYFKRFPSCRWTHAALDATVVILQKHFIQPPSVKSILVETFQEALALNNYRPKSLEGLQFSLPYTLALLVVEREFGVKQMSLKFLNSRSIQEMADRIKIVVDPVLNQMFPKRRPARVTITTDQGDSFTEEILEVHGEPGSHFAVEGVRDKFFQLVSGRFDKQRAHEIYEMVDHLESLPSLQPLIDFLSG